jgi:pimeloyl-ACP methyl ester carboxylesterase
MTSVPHSREEPRLHHVSCFSARGLHRMAYWEWGDPANVDVVVCVHGLTRQGRDFDRLAEDLVSDPQRPRRVVCPDVVGRGHSDRLADPMAYGLPTYVADMVTLLARLNVPQVDWVGTSMGGLIGLGLAGLPTPAGALPLVRRLVLNDVGPTIEPVALRRIGSYVGQPAWWPTEQSAAAALRVLAEGFGPHTDDEWLRLSRPQLRPVAGDQGPGFGLHYDPAIAQPFRAVTPEAAAAGEALLWHAYDSLRCPTLVLRGGDSDLLSPTTAQAMTQRGPRAQLHEFPGVGHAPTLVQPEQRQVVRDFLRAP